MVRSLLGSPSVGSVGSPCRHVCAPCRCRVPKQLDAPSSVCSSSPVAPRATVGSGGCSITCRGGARGPGSKSVLRHPRSLDPGRERAPRTQPCSGVHSSSPVIFHLASLPRSHRAVPVLSPVPFPPHAEGRCPPEPGLTCPLLPGSSVPPSREGKGWGSPSAPHQQDGGLWPFLPKPLHAHGAGKKGCGASSRPGPCRGMEKLRGSRVPGRSTGGAGGAQRGVGRGGEASRSCSRCCAASWQCCPLSQPLWAAAAPCPCPALGPPPCPPCPCHPRGAEGGWHGVLGRLRGRIGDAGVGFPGALMRTPAIFHSRAFFPPRSQAGKRTHRS